MNSNPLLDTAVRTGLITPEQAAEHPDIRTPEELVTTGLVKAEDLGGLQAALLEAAKEIRQDEARAPFGRYRIIEELGHGGMGVVYRAEDTLLRREVALKVMRPDSSMEECVRFSREARAAAALKHPNVVPVFDVGDSDGRPFLVMELVQGRGFDRMIELRSLQREEAVDVLRQAAEGVAYAHEKGVLHRDLKPANILVTPAKQAVVMDFGLAKMTGADEIGITVSGVVFGTPAYMSPEQARGKWNEVDARSDVYSLGATLYEVLTGQPPFNGASAGDVMRQVLFDEPIAPRAIDATIARDLETICLKALEKDRARRYAHAGEFAADLRRYLAGESILASPPSLWFLLRKKLRGRASWLVAAGAVAVTGLLALALLAAPGTARIESDPPGASIWIGGEDSGQRTPADVRIWPSGRREIQLRLDGYEIDRFEVHIRPRDEIRQARSLIPDHGILAVGGTEGAEVLAAGRLLGTTPISTRVPRGDLEIEVRKPGFQTLREVVAIQGTVTVDARLAPEPIWQFEIESRFVTPAGDLDSDGADDCLVAESAAITAVSNGKRLWRTLLPDAPAQFHVSRTILVLGENFCCACDRDGKLLWSIPVGVSPTQTHRPGDVDGDGCADFVTLAGDKIDLRSGKTGLILWSDTIGLHCGPPLFVIAADVLVFLPGYATLHAYDRAGRRLWSNFEVPMLEQIRLIPDANGDGKPDLLAIPRTEIPVTSKFRCLSGADGTEIWAREIRARADLSASPLILCQQGDRITLMEGGKDRWSQSPGDRLGPSVMAGDLDRDGVPDAVVPTGDFVLRFLSGKDGRPFASFSSGRRLSGPLGVDGFLLVGGVERVWAVAGTGELLWEARFAGGPVRPVAALGRGVLAWSPTAIHLLKIK